MDDLSHTIRPFTLRYVGDQANVLVLVRELMWFIHRFNSSAWRGIPAEHVMYVGHDARRQRDDSWVIHAEFKPCAREVFVILNTVTLEETVHQIYGLADFDEVFTTGDWKRRRRRRAG